MPEQRRELCDLEVCVLQSCALIVAVSVRCGFVQRVERTQALYRPFKDRYGPLFCCMISMRIVLVRVAAFCHLPSCCMMPIPWHWWL